VPLKHRLHHRAATDVANTDTENPLHHPMMVRQLTPSRDGRFFALARRPKPASFIVPLGLAESQPAIAAANVDRAWRRIPHLGERWIRPLFLSDTT
jgi:hypothetical protein